MDVTVEQVIEWMERGCPVFLREEDDIARPVGNTQLAAAAFRRGLAAIGEGIEQDDMVWRRKGCCVCGVTYIPHPDVDLAAQFGHPKPKPERVTWKCQKCGGLVCRNCVKTEETDLKPPFDKIIPDETICTRCA